MEFKIIAHLVLGLYSTNDSMGMGSEGNKQCNHSFVNMLLANFTMIINLHLVTRNGIVDDQ